MPTLVIKCSSTRSTPHTSRLVSLWAIQTRRPHKHNQALVGPASTNFGVLVCGTELCSKHRFVQTSLPPQPTPCLLTQPSPHSPHSPWCPSVSPDGPSPHACINLNEPRPPAGVLGLNMEHTQVEAQRLYRKYGRGVYDTNSQHTMLRV
jgi:hypothetical protein